MGLKRGSGLELRHISCEHLGQGLGSVVPRIDLGYGGLGFRVSGLKFGAQDVGCRLQGSRCNV